VEPGGIEPTTSSLRTHGSPIDLSLILFEFTPPSITKNRFYWTVKRPDNPIAEISAYRLSCSSVAGL
jgi:hypothetical protein